MIKLLGLLIDFGRPSEHSPQRLAPLIDRVLTLANVKSIRGAQTLAADGLSNFRTSLQKTRHCCSGFPAGGRRRLRDPAKTKGMGCRSQQWS